MSWTALLERRFVPPDATIVGELSCIHCGYGLTGARAGGACPECGQPVRDSLQTIPAAGPMAAACVGIGRSYAMLLALPLTCAAPLAPVALVIAGLGTVWRLIEVRKLRGAGGGARLAWMERESARLLWSVVAEACVTAAALAGCAVAVAAAPGTLGSFALRVGLLAPCLAAAGVSMFFASSCAAAVMRRLERPLALRVANVARWCAILATTVLAALGLQLAAGALLGTRLPPLPGLQILLFGLLFLAALFMAYFSLKLAEGAILRHDDDQDIPIDRPMVSGLELLRRGRADAEQD